MNNEIQHKTSSFIEHIKRLIKEAQIGVVLSVNSIMVQTYFKLIIRLVEHEQDGRDYSNYGDYILNRFSSDFSNEFGRGF